MDGNQLFAMVKRPAHLIRSVRTHLPLSSNKHFSCTSVVVPDGSGSANNNSESTTR
jgi:hypothetical protein